MLNTGLDFGNALTVEKRFAVDQDGKVSGLNDFIVNFDFKKNKDTLKAKILDYGLSRIISEDEVANTMKGTPAYLAPEVLMKGTGYTSSCDVWSVGTMLFEMLNGFHPFRGKNTEEILRKIQIGTYEFRADVSVSDLGRDFLKGCLKYDVKDRFTWQQIFNDPYLRLDNSSNFKK